MSLLIRNTFMRNKMLIDDFTSVEELDAVFLDKWPDNPEKKEQLEKQLIEKYKDAAINSDGNPNRKQAEAFFSILNLLKAFSESMTMYVAAFEAYSELVSNSYIFGEVQNPFGCLAIEAIDQSSQMEMMRFFDKSGDKNKNCCLALLKEFLSSDYYNGILSSENENQYVKLIDSLYDLYDSLDMRHMRNKKVAHHDLKEIQEEKPSLIDFNKVKGIVNIVRSLLNDLYLEVYKFAPTLTDYVLIKDIYKKGLLQMMQKSV